MKTPGPTAGPTPAPAPQPAPTWRVGQILEATVGAVANGRVTLLAGDRQLTVQTPLPLQVGQPVRLQVEQLGDRPTLRLIPPNSTPSAADPAAAAVRQLLPRQAPLAPLFSAALALAQSPPPTVSGVVLDAVRTLLKQLGDANSMSQPRQLRQAIENAATPLESKLLQTPPDGTLATGDLRINLLRLIAALQSALVGREPAGKSPPGTDARTAATPAADWPRSGNPPTAQAGARAQPAQPVEASGLVEELLPRALAALARLELNQLTPANRGSQATTPEWLVEIPVQRGSEIDIWSLRLVRDQDRTPGNRHEHRGRVWLVQMAFDLPQLGPVQAQVRWSDAVITAGFWAEREESVPLIRSHLHELESALRGEGLNVDPIICHRGTLPVSPTAHQSLLDERA